MKNEASSLKREIEIGQYRLKEKEDELDAFVKVSDLFCQYNNYKINDEGAGLFSLRPLLYTIISMNKKMIKHYKQACQISPAKLVGL